MERRTQLYKVVENALFPEARSSFGTLFMDYLSTAGPTAALTGFSDTDFHSAITSALQYYSNDMYDRGHQETASKLWNPLVAGLLKFFLTEQLHLDNHESRTKGRKENLLAVKQPANSRMPKPSIAQPSVVADTTSLASKELDVNAVAVCSDLPPLLRDKAKPRYNSKVSSGASEKASPEVRTALLAFAKCNEVTLFQCLPWIRKTCKVKTCPFCRDLFMRSRVTRCGSENFHPCSEQQPCTPIGWFPHVCPKVWRMLRGAHNKGLPFRGKHHSELATPCLEKWDPVHLTSSSDLPTKRRKVADVMARLNIDDADNGVGNGSEDANNSSGESSVGRDFCREVQEMFE
jgi:hypothetical protein